MSTFTLTAIDGGRLVLSTERALTLEEYEGLKRAYDAWKVTPDGVLIIADCVARRSSRDLEFDVDPHPSAAEARHERLLEDPFEREYAKLRAAQDDPLNCSNCGEPLLTHVECGEFG